MKQLKFMIIGVLAVIVLVTGCKKEDNFTNIQHENVTNSQQGEGAIKLGKKLENPYSLKNMQKAYSNLKSDSRLKSAMTESDSITASHLYVRFLPKDSLENSILIKDTTLELFTYPLDYEITETGTYYHDPTIPVDQPTWLYTAVPHGYVFPSIRYEILDECYIPEENNTLKSSTEFLAFLEIEAYKISGNEKQIDANTLKSTKWGLPSLERPTGRVQVINNARTPNVLQGIRGVKVRTHNFVKIGTGWTDNNGNYSVNERYRTNVNYNIVFENADGFKIWGNWAFFSPAIYDFGWHSKTGRSIDIYTNSVAWLWSTINNAAYDYNRKCDALNIPRPPSDLRIWNMRIKGNWAGSAPMARHIALDINSLMDFLTIGYAAVKSQGWTIAISLCMPDIFILHNDSETNSRSVYETVYHELAHASHYQQVGKAYWLKYIAHIVANGGYGKGTEWLAGYAGVGEIWGNFFGADCGRHEYGFLSGFNWREDWYNPGFFMDLHDLNGFTERELFNCLQSEINTLNKLRDELNRRYSARSAAINTQFGVYFP